MRGAEVIARAERFLDSAVPLSDGSHSDVVELRLEDGAAAKRLVTQRKHNRLSVVPHIEVGLDGNHLFIENNGLGPAKITSFTGTVGKKTYDLGVPSVAVECVEDLLKGQPVPVQVDVRSVPAGTLLPTDDRKAVYHSMASVIGGVREELFDKAAKSLELRVEYEPIYGDVQDPCCWA